MHAVPVIRLFTLTSRACMILPHVQAIPSSLYSKLDFRQKCSSQNAQLLLKSSAIKCSLNKTKQWHRSISVSSYLFFCRFSDKDDYKIASQETARLFVRLLLHSDRSSRVCWTYKQCDTREVYFTKCICIRL